MKTHETHGMERDALSSFNSILGSHTSAPLNCKPCTSPTQQLLLFYMWNSMVQTEHAQRLPSVIRTYTEHTQRPFFLPEVIFTMQPEHVQVCFCLDSWQRPDMLQNVAFSHIHPLDMFSWPGVIVSWNMASSLPEPSFLPQFCQQCVQRKPTFLYDYLQASQPLFIKSVGLLVHSSHGLPFYSQLMPPRYPYLWLSGFALANPGSSGIW